MNNSKELHGWDDEKIYFWDERTGNAEKNIEKIKELRAWLQQKIKS